MKKKGSIKNKSNLERALASAEQIPIGGLNSVFSHIQLFKSRLEGIQKYVRDKSQINKAPPPQRNQASIWSNIINSSKNNLDIRNNLQGKYKQVFDQYRASIKEQIRAQIDTKNSIIEPRSPKANEAKGQLQPQLHTFGKNKKSDSNSVVPPVVSEASLNVKPVIQKKPIATGFPFGIASNPQNMQNIFNTPMQAPSGKVQTKNMPGLFQSNISSNMSFNNPFSMASSPFSLTPQQPKKVEKPQQTKKIEEQAQQKPSTSIKGGVKLDTEANKPAIDIFSTANWSINRQVDKPITEFKSTNNLFSEGNPLAGQAVKQQVPPQFFNLPKKTENPPPSDKIIQIQEKIENPEIKQKAKLFPKQQKQQKETFGFAPGNLFAKSNFGQSNQSISSNPFSNNNQSQNQTPTFNFMNKSTAQTSQPSFLSGFPNNSNFKNIFNNTLETPKGQSKEQLKLKEEAKKQRKEQPKQQPKQQNKKEYAKFSDGSQQMVFSFDPSQGVGIRRRRRSDLDLDLIDQQIITQQIKEEAKNINPFSKKPLGQAAQKSFFNVKPVQNNPPNQDLTPKNEPKENLTFADMKNPKSLFSTPNSLTPPQTKPNMSSLFSQGAAQNKAFTPNQNNNPFQTSFSINNNESKPNVFGAFSNASSLFKNTSDSQGLFGKPKQGSLFGQSTPQGPLFGNSNPQQSIFGNNQEQKQGGGSNEDNDADEQQLMRQQQMDSDPNKSNAKYEEYCESEVLFKETALKFKRGTKETMDNIITSIQKVNKSNNLSIIARLPNKRQIFYGVYMPKVTEIIPAKDNHASLTVKKIAFTDENSKTALQMLKMKFKDESTGRRFEEILTK